MSQKLQTPLHHFRFNRETQKRSLNIDWFKYDLDESVEDNISGFTPKELELFRNFTLANDLNFSGDKNYHLTNSGEIPVQELLDLVHDPQLNYPTHLILLPKPEIERSFAISPFMKIILLNAKGEHQHNYDLPFGVIGRVLNL